MKYVLYLIQKQYICHKEMKTLNEEVNRIKSIMGLIVEQPSINKCRDNKDVENLLTILIDGTSSAGKSWVINELKAVPFHKATDKNQWVIIASDDFNGYSPENEERRLAFDPPSIRDWAKGHDFGITSGIHRKAGEDVPPNPKENEYVGGPNANAAAWYMAQEFKCGGWNKVIFDDVTNDILNYIPNIKHNVLLHAPIYMLIKNIVGRNKEGKEDPNWRNPTKALDQYLEKYEATTEKPKENEGDPTTVFTKRYLENVLSDDIDDKKYIDDFIRELGVVGDGIKYYIKVKNEYRTPNLQLINIDSERKVYLDKFKEIVT